MSLDPDDPRPPYLQVATALRAAILTRKIEPGDKLPSQNELAERYGVSRMTIQQALRVLKDESLVVSRQGSGVFARERTEKPVGLRPHIEKAFEADEVSIDFLGYTAETLHGAIAEPLDKIRAGRLTPKSIRIRILVSDMTQPLALPVAVDGLERDSAAARARMNDLSTRYIGGVTDAVQELADLGLVPDATVETRRFTAAPMFKAYVINGADAFFGYYPVVKHDVRTSGRQVSIYDPMGKDTVLFHWTDDGDIEAVDTQFVIETRNWFDSVWNTIAVEDAQ
ncbi:GntR family transcriptional regulator [Isoptericola dokdonensis]|uniref:HTH-type transcriptional repressor YvoA n=1 Tax=Isoptericola dokdonensis DS-3 TaxID=1300344 RepID=A0A168FS26_9MICO|nr:GntR family transcriptional regulator [Isoptericola dokdonensis]ANC32389.1 HTH-type transcriptional repressor YvoA [Isoptericola dokdonensis DS-3]